MFPAPNSMQRVSSGKKEPRAKVALKPGHSLMDWIRHANSNVDVQKFMGRIRAVTEEELAKHNTRKDCWMSVRGEINDFCIRRFPEVPHLYLRYF